MRYYLLFMKNATTHEIQHAHDCSGLHRVVHVVRRLGVTLSLHQGVHAELGEPTQVVLVPTNSDISVFSPISIIAGKQQIQACQFNMKIHVVHNSKSWF
jgi:hypothetical protein